MATGVLLASMVYSIVIGVPLVSRGSIVISFLVMTVSPRVTRDVAQGLAGSAGSAFAFAKPRSGLAPVEVARRVYLPSRAGAVGVLGTGALPPACAPASTTRAAIGMSFRMGVS